jgi:hypothetical protein
MTWDAIPLLPTRATAGTTRAALVLALFAVMLVWALFFDARPAYAKTVTVNSTSDLGTGGCDVTECTLREAIDATNDNNTSTIDTVKFNIPTTQANCSAPTNVCTIFTDQGMPVITEPLTIDGYSQGKGTTDTTADDAKPNTLAVGNDAVLKIELKSVTGVGAGLWIGAKRSTVKGLVINEWSEGVRISGSGARANRVEGNFIGTDASGTLDRGNSLFGVVIVDAPTNTVGGTTPAKRNVISGHGPIVGGPDGTGIAISGTGAKVNKVMGNYIGTKANGTEALKNARSGVFVIDGAANNTVGGTKAGARNVISGNFNFGVEISSFAFASSNRVMGNYIGTDATGTQALGNQVGVVIDSAPDNTVGGTTVGARNIISGNGSAGVSISGSGGTGNKVMGNYIGTDKTGTLDLGNSQRGVSIFSSNNTVGGTTVGARNIISNNGSGVIIVATRNRILSNSIYNNDKLGINLNGGTEDGFGVTANDPGDGDTGGNNLQNFPVLSSAQKTGDKTTITGTLNSTASTTFTIQFFSSLSADPSGNGEGQKFLSQKSVTTDASGNASFTATTPVVLAGQVVSATATNESTGDTSEFSVAVPAS